MKHMLFVGSSVFGIAAAANAASLSVGSDKLTYAVGETITLTVTGDDAGAVRYGVFGRLDYGGALVDNGTRNQLMLVGQNGSWITGTLPGSDNGVDAYSFAFNQIAGLTPDTAINLPAAFATVTLIAKAVGFVNVNWHTVPDGAELDFFGLTSAPGTSFTIVPEPDTSVLVALGLFLLGGALRRPGGT
jgi:hypothetical protein